MRECIGALGQTNPLDDRTELSNKLKIIEGTGKWILDDGVFKRWTSEEPLDPALIWVCDDPSYQPGNGKTALAISISEYLEQAQADNDKCWVLYFFCDLEKAHRNNAASILKGLIFSLYYKKSQLGDILEKEYAIQHEHLFKPHSVSALWRIFQMMVDASGVERIFCIIDGLDKCEEEQLSNFVCSLSKHFRKPYHERLPKPASPFRDGRLNSLTNVELESGPLTDLRVIILSREHPKCVAEALSAFPRVLLRNDGSNRGESGLEHFTEAKINKISTGLTDNKEVTEETSHIITKALGDAKPRSVLWVSLMAEKLLSMTSAQVEKYVVDIPKSVEGMHIRTLLGIPSGQRAHVSVILKWVCLAARPLSTLELTKAVKYDSRTSFSKKNLKKALSHCSGLIDQQDKKVTLAHQSVREVLFGNPSPLQQYKALKCFSFDRADAHSELTNACISYLQQSANMEKSRRVRLQDSDKLKGDNKTFINKHPFLEYAIAHWPTHAKRGNLEKTDYDVEFFKEDSPRRKLWWESYWISLRRSFSWKWTAPGKFSLLHLAAFLDIVPLAMYVERRGSLRELLDAQDHQGMKPINWATERSQPSMVRFLLQRGEFNDDALRQAARTGEVSIIKMLLENREKALASPRTPKAGSSPNIATSPLQSFRKVTLNSLSEWSKKLDGTNGETSSPWSPDVKGYGNAITETPLHIAATCGRDNVVEALLAAGEDLHRATDGGWTVLHNAAWFGRTSIVNLLLESGAYVQAETKELLTPLHCAVKKHQLEVVHCLLDNRSTNVEAKDKFGLTSFHIACKSNNIPMMEVLLHYGANIEQRMSQGWTPLLWASVSGQHAVAHFLLGQGADVNAKWVQVDSEGQVSVELGPIGLAKAYRQENIACLLERYGANRSNEQIVGTTEALQLPQPVVEVYHVPEVEDIVCTQQEGRQASGSLDVDGSNSVSESEGESDDGNETSDNEDCPRQQSTSSVPEDLPKDFRPDDTVLGLGIHEEPDVDLHLEVEQVNAMPVTCIGALGVTHEATVEQVDDRPEEVKSEGEMKSESAVYVEGTKIDQTCHDPNIEALDHASDDFLTDLPSGSGAKSPGLLGLRFTRFMPKTTFNRPDSAMKDNKPALPEASESPLESDGESRADARRGSAGPVSDPPKTDTGILGRFGAKKGLSWKKGSTAGTRDVSSSGVGEELDTDTT